MTTVIGDPTIRDATPADLAAVEKLLPAGHEQLALPRVLGRRHLLVLDAPDSGLAAAALVEIDGARGHLVLLGVDKRFEGYELENRIIGVAESLCRAFGADTLDVPARRAA